MNYSDYTYTRTSDLSRKAQSSLHKANRKKNQWHPVEVVASGRKICTTWWGEEWCKNMERYSDYENRLSRGKRYVRAGCVVDLQVKKGLVLAKVQGSRARPYNVEIHIDPLPEKRVEELMSTCSKKIDSLEDLAAGKFPGDLKTIFSDQGGLFPTPREIHFSCSCPDWAYMCKHVAAVMYAIGVRVDEDPLYFFELRGIDARSMIRQTVTNKVDAMLAHANDPSARILDLKDCQDVFGLDLEDF